MAMVLIASFVLSIAAATTLVVVHGRYWRRAHQPRLLWALLLVGPWLLPADNQVARIAIVAVPAAFFLFGARPAVAARRADLEFRSAAERQARGETTDDMHT